MIDGILSTAAYGLRSNAASAANAADRLVKSTSRPAAGAEEDILTAVVDLKRAETGFKANATTFRTGSEMTGQLIDILV